ncbi:MAG: hypothetical protein IJB52_08085 [Clostridia bacterium]|nr:hypothetical protein [Clostridia bacterium]
MKQRILSAVLLITVVFLLTGCSGSRVPESRIRADIEANDSFITSCGLTIRDYSESEHQTNKETGREIVSVLATTENEFVEVRNAYTLYYIKYDKDWQLVNFDQDTVSYTAKTPVDNSRVKQDVQELYREKLAEYNLTSQQFGEPEQVLEVYDSETSFPYCVYRIPFTGENDSIRVDAALILGYKLNLGKGWEVIDSTSGCKDHFTEVEISPVSNGDSTVAAYMQEEGMESYEIESVEERSAEEYIYHILATDTDGSKYATKHFRYELTCKFSEYHGWQIIGDDGMKLVDAEPHIEGTWLYEYNSNSGTYRDYYLVHVDRMDMDTITIRYEMVVSNSYITGFTRTATEPVTVDHGILDHDTRKLILVTPDLLDGEGREYGISFKLRFETYSGRDYEESGLYVNGDKMTKIS